MAALNRGSMDLSASAVLAASRTSMPVLLQQSQLEKMLADEKIRSLQHKENYGKLKAEHKSLQDECLNLETQLKESFLDKTSIDERYRVMLDTARTEIANRQSECYILQDQAMSKDKLDMLRTRIVEELEPIYGAKVKQLAADNETQASELTRLRYEHQFLQSEYDNEKEQFARIASETRIRHEAEIVNLRKERENIIAEHVAEQTSHQGDAQRVRCLARENDHLHLKIKGITEELEEMRKQKDSIEANVEVTARVHAKHLSETTTNLKSTKAELDSLKLQLDSQSREMNNLEELKARSGAREHALKQELILQTSASDEARHRWELDAAATKMSVLKERIELEKERDNQRTVAEELACQVETLQSIIRNQTQRIEEKEREIIAVTQSRSENERSRIHELESNKIDLENRLTTVTTAKSDRETQLDDELSRLNERFRQTETLRTQAIKEASTSKAKLAQHQVLVEQLERERTQNCEMKSRLTSIESQYRNYITNKQELSEINDKLKKQTKMLSSTLEEKEKLLIMEKSTASEILLQNKTSWADERIALNMRISDLDESLKQCSTKLANCEINKKQQVKKMIKTVTRLKSSRSSLTLSLENLKAENQALKQSVIPNDERTRKQLKDLWRRNMEFNGIIMSDNQFCDRGLSRADNEFCDRGDGYCLTTDAKLNSKAVSRKSNSIFDLTTDNDCIATRNIPKFRMSPHDADLETIIPAANKPELFEAQHNDLQILKERLNQLDDSQRQQMQNLKTFQSNLGTNSSHEIL